MLNRYIGTCQPYLQFSRYVFLALEVLFTAMDRDATASVNK